MIKKIKICFIEKCVYYLFNPNWPKSKEDVYGGVDVDIYLLAKNLAKDNKFEVSVIVGDFGQKDIEIIDNVKLIKGYKPFSNKIFMSLKLIKVLLKENSDIYFLEKANGSNAIIRFISKLKNKKLIYRTASDIDCNGSFIKNNKLNGKLYYYALKRSDLIIVQNNKNKDDLYKNHNLTSIIIKNSIIFDKNKKYKKEFLTWIGRRETIKRPELLVKLCKFFNKENFLMISPKVNTNNYENLEKEIINLSNLKVVNFIPYKDIMKSFYSSKIFINTSDYEGFPNTFVQACASRTPIVSLNVNPDGFLDKYKCGFCANGDLELMKKQINQLLTDKKLYNKMSKNAYNYAKNNHDVKNIIKQYKKVIIDLYNA